MEKEELSKMIIGIIIFTLLSFGIYYLLNFIFNRVTP